MPSFQVMGILNLTPDSFSDGGIWNKPDRAIARVQSLFDQGADLVDIGAESTRPGAEPLSSVEEQARLFPVLDRLVAVLDRKKLRSISIDTRHPDTALKCAEAGVGIINNVAGLFADKDLQQLAGHGCSFIAMHMNGTPQTMQQKPLTRKLASTEVVKFAQVCQSRLVAAGFPSEAIYIDPGIGFGKTDGANLELMTMVALLSKQHNVAIGISRKSMFGRMLGIVEASNRDIASKMTEYLLGAMGAKIVRTHEVKTLVTIRDTRDHELE